RRVMFATARARCDYAKVNIVREFDRFLLSSGADEPSGIGASLIGPPNEENCYGMRCCMRSVYSCSEFYGARC
ncbi:MAG: hypothetical protein AAAC47_28590, partial [Pararhizobium sp.]